MRISYDLPCGFGGQTKGTLAVVNILTADGWIRVVR
jgi:hypothetical protein